MRMSLPPGTSEQYRMLPAAARITKSLILSSDERDHSLSFGASNQQPERKGVGKGTQKKRQAVNRSSGQSEEISLSGHIGSQYSGLARR